MHFYDLFQRLEQCFNNIFCLMSELSKDDSNDAEPDQPMEPESDNARDWLLSKFADVESEKEG